MGGELGLGLGYRMSKNEWRSVHSPHRDMKTRCKCVCDSCPWCHISLLRLVLSPLDHLSRVVRSNGVVSSHSAVSDLSSYLSTTCTALSARREDQIKSNTTDATLRFRLQKL